MATDARERFRQIVSGPEDQIDLAEASLWLAAEACPDLDVDAYLARLDSLADAIAPTLVGEASTRARVEILNRELFGTHGFHGSRDDYYDPDNSFLNAVLDRRAGIPITLCVVYIEIARRLGLAAAGINFPGHFLARVGEEPLIVDAFEGRIASLRECELRLRAALGDDARLGPAQLEPAGKKQILARMLGNLKTIYTGRRDFEAALGCCERSLILAPDSPIELRDRGLIYHALDCARPALADLLHYLEIAPDNEAKDPIRLLVAQLQRELPAIH